MRSDIAKQLRTSGKQAGDEVHIKGKPYYIYEMSDKHIVLVSMDERKVFTTLRDKSDTQGA
jgi:hypothetical protein